MHCKFLLSILTIITISAAIDLDIVNVWKGLGWKTITLHSSASIVSLADLVIQASNNNISLILVPLENETLTDQTYHAFDLVNTSFSLLKTFKKRPPRPYSVMIIVSQDSEFSVNEQLKKVNVQMGIFKVTKWSTRLELFRIQTTRENVLIQNRWYQSQYKGRVSYEEVYDMRMANIKTISLTWEPWLTLRNCIGDEKNCDSFGILTDTMNILSGMYNFSWTVDRDKNGLWGSSPVSGSWSDISQGFQGVLGSVVMRKHDIAKSYVVLHCM